MYRQAEAKLMTEITSLPKLVTVFGGSGFLGRHVVRALAKRGYRIRAAVRRPDLAGHLQPLGNVGQIQAVQANLRHRGSVEHALAGADHAVNLVGILFESGRQNFNAVQEFGPRVVAEAAKAVGAGLTQVSAIGADPQGRAIYARTKGRGEQAVQEIMPDAAIVRPSHRLWTGRRLLQPLRQHGPLCAGAPLIGGGHTRFQPVFVGDVAEAIARLVDGQGKPGTTWELGGPDVLPSASAWRRCCAS